jgi:type II pantothenate kinase
MSTVDAPKGKMLVSIGSGVSIIKVLHNGQYERVSGTMIGGGTLVGLSNLLTGIKDFDQICELS